MVATGTGLAPLQEHAANRCWTTPIARRSALYWGMRTEADLYLHEEIAELGASGSTSSSYVPVLSRADAGWSGRRGHVQQAVVEDLDDLSEHSIYLCGSPAMIADAKEAFIARGASTEHLYADGFSIQSP